MFYLYKRTTSLFNYDSKILGTKVQNALKNFLLIGHVSDHLQGSWALKRDIDLLNQQALVQTRATQAQIDKLCD